MALKDRKLEVGTKLVARYKKEEHRAEVVAGEGDKTLIRLADGREFTSVSATGSAVMGGVACNGWRFWSLAGSEETKPKKTSKKAAKENGNAGNGLIRRMDDGRYFCSACQEAFDVPAEVEPQGCPKGHRPDDFETS